MCRLDYAACLGDRGEYNVPDGINSPEIITYITNPIPYDDSFPWGNTSIFHGISYIHSEVRVRDITDGTSNTYCLGEKPINPDCYFTGRDGGDDWCSYTGQQDDTTRAVGVKSGGVIVYNQTYPIQDTPGVSDWPGFGSAHAIGMNMSFCDGSVRMINYSIDQETHHRLGCRDDGLTVDPKAF